MAQIEEGFPVGVPVAGCDVGQFRNGDPAEVQSALVADVADRKSGFAAGPREFEVGWTLFDRASWSQPVELDLRQPGPHAECRAELHDHESPGGRSAGEGTHHIAVVGAY